MEWQDAQESEENPTIESPKRRLYFHYHADLDDLLRGNMEERTRMLGVAAEEDEEAFRQSAMPGFGVAIEFTRLKKKAVPSRSTSASGNGRRRAE